MKMCVNHSQNKATHLKDSYFKSKPPNPICDKCVENYKKYYHAIYYNLNIRPIKE